MTRDCFPFAIRKERFSHRSVGWSTLSVQSIELMINSLTIKLWRQSGKLIGCVLNRHLQMTGITLNSHDYAELLEIRLASLEYPLTSAVPFHCQSYRDFADDSAYVDKRPSFILLYVMKRWIATAAAAIEKHPKKILFPFSDFGVIARSWNA